MPTNFSSIQTTRGREYRPANIAKIDSALAYLPIQQRASIIGSIIEESGGDPLAKNETGAYQGLLQWGADRYQIQSDDPNVELNNQIQYIKETLNDTTDHKSWTDGGKGSGYKSFRDTYGGFTNPASDLDDVFRAFSFGYVRPQGKQDSFENRLKVVKQVYDRMRGDYLPTLTGHTEQPDATRVARPVLPVHMKGEGGPLDSSRQWDNLSLSEKSDIMREAVANGITSLREIRQAYNEYAEGGIMDELEGTVTENQESIEAAKYNDGSHLFNDGGYKPSASIMRDIANWEGSSMETNRSFEAEARDFNRVIPRSVMSRLSQEQLDALYSYGYNVGMGNLKKRVLPTLTAYTQGRAGAEDVASSMWASRDKDLLGLRRRRAWERDMFTNQMSDRDLRSYRTSNALLSASIDEGIRKLNEAINAGSAYQDYTLPYPVPAPFNPTVYDDAWTVLGQDEPQQGAAEPVIVEEKRDPLALMRLVEEMTTPPASSPLADYKPQATGYEGSGQGMYVPSFAHSHASMLDDSWFAEGGHLFDGTGESWLTTGVEMVPPEKLMFNPETGNVITDHTDHGVIVLPDVVTTTKANGYGLKDDEGNYYNTSAGNYPRLVGDKVGGDINKVVLGSMALGTAPITLPEMATAGVALSDGMMATRAGQGIGSTLANPYFNASMTALGAGDAYNTLSNEGLTYMNAPLTALELAPAYRLARPVYELGKNVNDYWALENFIKRYEYNYNPKLGLIFDNKKLDRLTDQLVRQHNTFARGVDVNEARKYYGFPKSMTDEEIAEYVLTRPHRPSANNSGGNPDRNPVLYTSNSIDLAKAYTNGDGYVGILQRPMLKGKSRAETLRLNDFRFYRNPTTLFSGTTDEPYILRPGEKRPKHLRNKGTIARKIKGKIRQTFTPIEPTGLDALAHQGAEVVPMRRPDDVNFRHYLFMGEEQEPLLNLVHMYKNESKFPVTDFSKYSVGLSKKKKYGGHLS